MASVVLVHAAVNVTYYFSFYRPLKSLKVDKIINKLYVFVLFLLNELSKEGRLNGPSIIFRNFVENI